MFQPVKCNAQPICTKNLKTYNGRSISLSASSRGIFTSTRRISTSRRRNPREPEELRERQKNLHEYQKESARARRNFTRSTRRGKPRGNSRRSTSATTGTNKKRVTTARIDLSFFWISVTHPREIYALEQRFSTHLTYRHAKTN